MPYILLHEGGAVGGGVFLVKTKFVMGGTKRGGESQTAQHDTYIPASMSHRHILLSHPPLSCKQSKNKPCKMVGISHQDSRGQSPRW